MSNRPLKTVRLIRHLTAVIEVEAICGAPDAHLRGRIVQLHDLMKRYQGPKTDLADYAGRALLAVVKAIAKGGGSLVA